MIIIALVAFFFGRKGGTSDIGGEIMFWGFEDVTSWREVIEAYEDQYGVKVIYQKKLREGYESELLNALAAGQGPDVFFIHHTWLNKHLEKLAPFPTNSFSPINMRSLFVEVVGDDLIRNDAVYGLPVYLDTLALYYNKSIFNTAGVINPPETWEEFTDVVKKIVIRDEDTSSILRAGAAFGASQNVAYSGDILQTLMLQNGTKMIDQERERFVFNQPVLQEGEQFKPGENALSFYTSFTDPATSVYTWHRRLADSLSAFKRGEVAMYIGYAKDFKEIKSSNIMFGVSPLPQVRNQEEDPGYIDLNFANYWAGAVNKMSYNRSTAQSFLRYISSRNAVYSFLSKENLPTARRDLIEIQDLDPGLKIFARQGLTAVSWPQPDYRVVTSVFNDMIEDVVLGRLSVEEALEDGVRALSN